MGKHQSGTESPEVSKRLLIAVPICLVMGLFAAVWMGPTLILDPATCDFKKMSKYDLCRHGHRSSEILIDNGALHTASGPYRNLEAQKSFNRVAGPLYLLGGLLFAAGSLYLGTLQIRALQARRELRTTDKDRPSHEQE